MKQSLEQISCSLEQHNPYTYPDDNDLNRVEQPIKEIVNLLQQNVNRLPCELIPEPTELPLHHESTFNEIASIFSSATSVRRMEHEILAIASLLTFLYMLVVSS